jgi:hypothetical protein
MPITQQNMGPRSGTTNAPWATPGTRRSGDNLTVVQAPGGMDTLGPPEITRISERVAEIERMLVNTRRQAPGNGPPVPPAPNANFSLSHPNFIPSPSPGGIGPPASGSGHPQSGNVVFPPPVPHNHFPGAQIPSGYPYIPPQPTGTGGPPRAYNPSMPLIPPPPPYIDDIYKDFSLTSPQEYFAHETRLYQRINFQAKIRLGYGKAISVLQRELDGSQEYERLTRPYQIDQPDNLPLLSPLIPNSEARLFADTVRALVDIIGLQRACHLLENAKVAEIPGIRYEIQRVIIPTRVPPIPMEPEGIPIPQSMPEIGPYARPRSDSIASIASSAPTTYSWSPAPMTMSPPPAPPPSSSAGEGLPSEELLPPPNIPPPPVPHRGILRRSASGSSYNGKRVTIQTDHDFHCGQQLFGTSTSSFESVISPTTSPMKTDDAQKGAVQRMAKPQLRQHSDDTTTLEMRFHKVTPPQ